jgi:glycyl-tRNA synthetase beta chain
VVEKKDLLVEIGTEELPPLALAQLSRAFQEQFVLQLSHYELGYEGIERFSTPRRLALRINALDVEQVSRIEVRRGPSVKAAIDKEGNFTQAALGFARSCGVDAKALLREETPKGAWLVYEHIKEGKSTATLISGMVEKSLEALPIPKRMRWANLSTEFVRPVHWIVLLFGEEPIKSAVLGIVAGQYTRGHRFHHPDWIKISSPKEYESILRDPGKVETNFTSRRERIKYSAEQAAATVGATVLVTSSLLDEVTALTEWPVAVIGSFDKKFLDVPAEALIETMQKNQKYFPLVDKNRSLVPYFITFSNIESKDPVQIVKGNERVITPRFKDAAFFWEQDLQCPLDTLTPELEKVVFQHKLGTLAEKTNRIRILCRHIGLQLGLDPNIAERAAELSKCDLLTYMVGEFPSLQGIMGKYYAKAAGEDECIFTAIEEQYLPRHAGDRLPTSKCGQAVALSDRIDSLVGIFAVGQRPTGVKDPYALRRASLSVLRILIETPLELDLKELIELSAETLQSKIDAFSVINDVLDYVMERLRGYYTEKGIRGDSVDAVLINRLTIPTDIDKRILAVEKFRDMAESKSLAAANKRIRNILKKYDGEIPKTCDISVLQQSSEISLAHKISSIRRDIQPLLDKGQYTEALSMLATLKDKVDKFFDEVMVMCDDQTLRESRLALLSTLNSTFVDIADISYLQ